MSRHTCGKGLPIEYWRAGPCAGCQAETPDAQPAAPPRVGCPNCDVPWVNAECPKCGDRDCSPAPTQEEPRTPDEMLASDIDEMADLVHSPALHRAAKRLRELAEENAAFRKRLQASESAYMREHADARQQPANQKE